MILTVTLNPAVDKTYETDELLKGQVNRLRSCASAAGGKGINVTRVLRQFGRKVAAAGYLGGYTGRMIEDTMMKAGVECHFTRISGETRTSMNILADTGYVTELLEPGPEVTQEEQEIFLQEFSYCLERCELVALCGSVPRGIPSDIYCSLIGRCRDAGKKVVLDTSGVLLKEAVKAAPYLIKPNRKELEYLVGRKLGTRAEMEAACKALLDMGISKIVVSLGEQGLLYFERGRTLFQRAPQISAVNTVGCGDSVVASLCMSELDRDEPETALRRAAALSAANVTTAESAEIPMEIYKDLLFALE